MIKIKTCAFWIGLLAVFLSDGVLQAADLAVPGLYPDLQSAYQASVEGDRIVVDDGIYTGAVNTLTLNGKSLILIGNGNNVVFDLENARQFLTTGTAQNDYAAIIENVNVLFGPQNSPSISITHGTFEIHQSNFYGHGNKVIDVRSGRNGSLLGCTFTNNSGFSAVSFRENVAEINKIVNCQFEHNLGAALDLKDNNLIVCKTEFLNNGVGIRSTSAIAGVTLRIYDSRFYINRKAIETNGLISLFVDRTNMFWNESAIISLGLHRATIYNSVIARNGVDGSSNSTIHLTLTNSSQWIPVRFDHCTIADNLGRSTVDINAANMEVDVTNSIIWNPHAITQVSGQWSTALSVFDYNIIKGGGYGTNVIDADPLFSNADALQLDYGLTELSPAINAGSFSMSTFDINGVDWWQDRTPDLGASEYCRYISKVSIMGSTELLFHGQPGESVGLAVSTQWDLLAPTPTPLGDFLLDLIRHYFVSNVGIVGSNGVFSLTYASSVTSPPFIWGQALIGPEFSKNALLLEIEP